MLSYRIRGLVRDQWAGLLALFLVLTGGSAYALGQANTVSSGDIIDNQVKSVDVRDDTLAGGGLQPQDLGPASVGLNELDPLAFQSGDIAQDSPTDPFQIAANAIQSGEVTDGSLTGADVAPSTLTGSDVATDSLTGADISEPTLAGFDGHDAYRDLCDTPSDNTFVNCLSVTFTLGHAMEVLATFGGGASHGSYSSDNTKAYGECQVRLDGADKLEPIAMENSGHSNTGMPTISDVMSLAAGSHTVALACRENPSDLEYEDLTIAVVELGFD